MKFSIIFAIFSVIAFRAVNSLESTDTVPTTTSNAETDPTTSSTNLPTTESSTNPPTTTSSTTVPTTTSSTEAPTTTISSTDVPTTTVTPPTTTSTEGPTTTISSSSSAPTTTQVPLTTPVPEPSPDKLPKGSWNVTDASGNTTCIRVEMKAYFVIPIEGKNEYIVLSPNATTDGSNCNLSNDSQSLVLTEQNHYTLTMIFLKQSGKSYVNETRLEYILPKGTGTVSSDEKVFSSKIGNSYLCNTMGQLKLDNVTMKFENVRMQAFGIEGDKGFGSADQCEADDEVSDAIPIAVGCALAALIIVVLIAYLVGRRRSRQRGYQSV